MKYFEKKNKINLPIIIRLEGTNVNIAKKILNNSKLHYYYVTSLEEAANKTFILLAASSREVT
uniref:hypothetical protein n=1 Tax=Candidatus Karelsulcia muelleri TaxID=336810 RepID=UPI00293BB88B|nr:hypothetical protein [Candidatus Karelsulcia muelleri]